MISGDWQPKRFKHGLVLWTMRLAPEKIGVTTVTYAAIRREHDKLTLTRPHTLRPIRNGHAPGLYADFDKLATREIADGVRLFRPPMKFWLDDVDMWKRIVQLERVILLHV